MKFLAQQSAIKKNSFRDATFQSARCQRRTTDSARTMGIPQSHSGSERGRVLPPSAAQSSSAANSKLLLLLTAGAAVQFKRGFQHFSMRRRALTRPVVR